jgi:hypothetical protein
VKFENAADITGRTNMATAMNGTTMDGTMMDIGTEAIIIIDRFNRERGISYSFPRLSSAAG